MNVLPHIYYTIEAVDLILPAEMKKRDEKGVSLKNIPAAVSELENPFNASFVMNDREREQKSTRELIKLVKCFCHTLRDMSDDYTVNPYIRPTYKIKMSRNAVVFISDNHLGGNNVSNTLDLRATNDGIFNFIYYDSHNTNKLIYKGNIRKILGQDFKYIHVLDNSYDYMHPDQESELSPDTPLYVCKYNEKEVYVKKIPNNMIIVNEKLCEISPQVTGHIPAHMSHLFNNKRESVVSAYLKRYRQKRH